MPWRQTPSRKKKAVMFTTWLVALPVSQMASWAGLSHSMRTKFPDLQPSVWRSGYARLGANWPFAKTRPLPYFCCVRQAVVLSRHTSCSHAVKNTSRSKEDNDNAPTDKTEQVTLGMKQSLSLQILSFCKKLKNKYRLWPFDVSWQIAVAAREPILSSSLVTAWNKHEWTSKGSLSCFAERCQYTPFVKFKSTDVNLLSSLVCLLDKKGKIFVMIDQIACQSNSLQKVNW